MDKLCIPWAMVVACMLTALPTALAETPIALPYVNDYEGADPDPFDLWGGDWSTLEAHSGTHSVRMGNSADWFYSPLLPQTGDGVIKTTFWTKGGGGYEQHRHSIRHTADWVEHTQFIRAGPSSRLGFHGGGSPLYLDDLSIEWSSAQAYRQWTKHQIANSGSSIQINKDSGTTARLPKTINALKTGQRWKVLLLGDSIQSDTFNSHFDLLLEDRFPNADVELVESTRSGTGMGWYAEDPDTGESHIPEYVLDYDADLVILGGISHSWDPAPYLDVIQQIKAGDPMAEILVTTGMAGDPVHNAGDVRLLSSWNFDLGESSSGFRTSLRDHALAEDVGFFDTFASWGRFMEGHDIPYSHFMRDSVHMNQNGLFVAAGIYEAYFAQAIPEPGSVILLVVAGAGGAAWTPAVARRLQNLHECHAPKPRSVRTCGLLSLRRAL